MDRDGPLRVLTDVQESSHDVVAGGAAVYEEQVIVLEASVREALRLVNLFVQSHDRSHVVLFEIRKVGFRSMERVTIFNFAFRMWSTKCQEFSWNDPVEVPIFNSLIMFIFIRIKCLKVKKSML